MIVSLIGVGALLKGWLPGGLSSNEGDARPVDVEPKLLQRSSCALCGTVESIRTIEVRDEAVGAAGATGGSAAAVASERTAGRSGGAAATFFGAGTAEHEIARKRFAYRVTVRMDDGSFRTVSLSSPPTLNVGDKVRVVEGKLVRT
jgi:outer membrane lipoprotein SlyB